MKLRIFLIFLTFLFLPNLFGKDISSHINEVDDGYNFWLSKPANDSTPKPVIIFLHGASLCGKDLNKVRRYGTIDAIEKGREIDAYVIAPQNPGGAWKPEKIMNVLTWIESTYNVDPNRVYVLGMSLGGYGTLSFCTTYPDKVAAALAMCGGNVYADSGPLNDVPLWIVHGTADRAVAVSQSDRVVESMKQADPETPRLIYDRVPGMNHSQPARILYMADTYDWLLSHNLQDEGRPVSESFELNAAQMKTAYKDLQYSSPKKTTKKKNSKKGRSARKKTAKKSSAKKSTVKRR